MRTKIGILIGIACLLITLAEITKMISVPVSFAGVVYALSGAYILYSCYVLSLPRIKMQGIDHIFYMGKTYPALLFGFYYFNIFLTGFQKNEVENYGIGEISLISVTLGVIFGFISVLFFSFAIRILRRAFLNS